MRAPEPQIEPNNQQQLAQDEEEKEFMESMEISCRIEKSNNSQPAASKSSESDKVIEQISTVTWQSHLLP